jgi:7-cyano-7-deazaguanine synthase in queuosine biosynthesis
MVQERDDEMSPKRIHCVASYLLDKKPRKVDAFEDGLPQLHVDGLLGSNGLSKVAMDLIDIGALVFSIERTLPGKQHVNRVSKIDLGLGLREPQAWTEKAMQALEELMSFMGGTNWNFDFVLNRTLKDFQCATKENASVQCVSLFSGGLDSLCGAATICKAPDIRLVSYYTSHQKDLQKRLAQDLGTPPPIQWGWKPRPPSGRGKSFRYRSFMFLCLAAATAQSYGSNRIMQFENGVLASGVAPSLSIQTTKHAHYRLHRLCETIFSEVLGGKWLIENPFEHKTKREVYLTLESDLGEKRARYLADQTETCWNLYAGFKIKKGKKEIKKKNGVPCGFCVPCLIRQTALPQSAWLDLRSDSARNDPIRGRFFREYYAMLQRIQAVRNGSLGEFYPAMDTFLQDAIQPRGGYTLAELRDLFLRFSDEFMDTYI